MTAAQVVTIEDAAPGARPLSPSQVNTFLDCQARWYYSHVLKLPDPPTGFRKHSGAPFTAQAQAMSLSLFAFNGLYAAATHTDGSLVGPATLYPGRSTPAAPGETIVLYGSGFGPASSSIAPGAAAQAWSSLGAVRGSRFSRPVSVQRRCAR